MQNPVLAMTKHLTWTRSGVVWATWRVQGMPYGFAADATKQLARLQHQALFQGIRGEALLIGLCAYLDPVVVAERMLAGIPVDEHPEWAEEVVLTLDSLATIPVGERAFWLSVPLAGTNARHRLRSAAHAVESELRDERLRADLTHDFHDVMAHSLAVLAAQAEGLRLSYEQHPERIGPVLTTISDTARLALVEVRQLLERVDDDARRPQPTTIDIPALVDRYMDGQLKLDPLISGRRPLDEAAEALDDLASGGVLRTLLIP